MENIFTKLQKNLIRINFETKDEIELFISYYADETIDGFFESSKIKEYNNTNKKYIDTSSNKPFVIYQIFLLNKDLISFLESFYVLINTLEEKNSKINEIKTLFDKQKNDLLAEQEEMLKRINTEFFNKIKDIIIPESDTKKENEENNIE
jgi:hypothetical protein